MSQGNRRLAAIMFTDMVGYTALGQRNEDLSLALVDELRMLVRGILTKHNGREVKTMGDAFLIEFPNALDAVRCAYGIQRATREFNLSMPADKRLHLRVGVHLGDVVESQGDISGDAVNIASRIEPLADDGGVCLSRHVYDQVRNKFEVPMRSMGERVLRNAALPVEVYKMIMPWNQTVTTSVELDKKRIAVLPLANFSSDKNDEYLADGMTEELISSTSSIRGLTVIARTSAMSYKGTNKKVAEIGAELGVGTVLEGSVRKAGGRLRITVQLIDVVSQGNLWGQAYDRDFDDIFAIQSEIAREVGEALKVRMLPDVARHLEKKPTKSTEAYTLYLKGRYYWNERTREATGKAVRYFEEAVKLDPGFALAYAGLADCYIIYENYSWMAGRDAFLRAKENALKAIELDPSTAEAHASLAAVKAAFEFDWRGAEIELRRAMELKPSYAVAHQWYSLQLWFQGRFAESYEEIEKASLLDPLSRVIQLNLGWSLVSLGRVKEGIEKLEKLIESEPDYAYARYYLGWALYMDSRVEEAVREMSTAAAMTGINPVILCDLICLLGLVGKREEAELKMSEFEEISKTVHLDKGRMAFALFGLGRVDEGFDYLEAGHEERSGSVLYFRSYPWFERWRGDPRWISIDRRLGFPHEAP